MTKKTPYKGLGADSEEKHEPVSDIDTAMVVDSLKARDPRRPIREAVISGISQQARCNRIFIPLAYSDNLGAGKDRGAARPP